MEQKKVKTKGSLKEMSQYTELDEQTIQGAIQVVENSGTIEVEVPSDKK